MKVKKKNKADFVDGDYSPGEALNICEQQQQKKNRRQKKQVARNGMFAVKNIVRWIFWGYVKCGAQAKLLCDRSSSASDRLGPARW